MAGERQVLGVRKAGTRDQKAGFRCQVPGVRKQGPGIWVTGDGIRRQAPGRHCWGSFTGQSIERMRTKCQKTPAKGELSFRSQSNSNPILNLQAQLQWRRAQHLWVTLGSCGELWGFHSVQLQGTAGSNNVKVEPLPNWLSTLTVPFMRSMMCLTMERPKPVPPTSRERALSTR